MSGRRATLARVSAAPGSTNPGLWFDRFLSDSEPENAQNNATLVRQTSGLGEPGEYAVFFARWRAELEEKVQRHEAQVYEARVLGRLAIGLGAESVIETAITLHRTYGVPVIPGSALKGLAAAFARQRLGEAWAVGQEAYRTAFGDSTQAGYLTFFDALYVPSSGISQRPLHPDVITVHHKDYYTSREPQAPADWDNPTPVPFVTASGRFLVALAGPPAWVTAAMDILYHALSERGVGAKTSSGYGRMHLPLSGKPDPGASGATSAMSAPDQARTSQQLPAAGEIFVGTVVAVDETVVLVEIPRFAQERAIGIIRAATLGGRTDRYRKGNTARVQVVSISPGKGGRQVVELKPAPR
mgnify:CR=1 FL=1